MSQINFENDKEDLIDRTDNIKSLAEQVRNLKEIDSNIKTIEKELADKKKTI